MESKDELINPSHGYKGLGLLPDKSYPIKDISVLKWNLLNEDISLPAAVLDEDKLKQNLEWMDLFLTKFKAELRLAPHGKTTMMPTLFRKVYERQKTWGFSLATAVQVKTAHDYGISKVIMANQLIGKRNMEIISEILENDPNFEFVCLIDSPEIVKSLGSFFKNKKQILKVLLEYGPNGGRTGVRDETQEKLVLSALEEWKTSIRLVGMEFYEGLLQTEETVRDFIEKVLTRGKILFENGTFQNHPVMITGAGSSWFDIVAEMLSTFSEVNPTIPLEIILRPGCYMIHDVGLYKQTTLRIESRNMMMKDLLQPALTIWTYVQSIPEPNLAIIAFGKRDGANDCGFPDPIFLYRPGSFEIPINIEEKGWKVHRMMDQHTFMEIQSGDDLMVGDMIVFNIAHPCTTMDKWRNVLVMNTDYNIVDVYQTFF